MIVKLDLFTTLLLSGIFTGFYIMASLIIKGDRKATTFFIFMATLIMTVILSQYFLVLSGGYQSFPYLLAIPLIILPSLGPVLFLFIKMSFDRRKFRWFELGHFAPSFLLLYLHLPILRISPEVKIRAIAMLWTGVIEFDWQYFIFLTLLSIQMSIYLFLISWILSKNYAIILQESSNTLVIKMTRMKLSMQFFIVFMIAFLCAYSFWSLQYAYTATIEGCMMLLMSAFIFPTGYHFLRNRIAYAPVSEQPISGKYKNSSLTDDSTVEILDRLTDHMKTKKPYLNPDLKIQDLSEELAVAKHHISQIINQELNSNFFDFINQYRVEEAKKKLIDDRYKHLTIQGIGMDSGFSNKSSFYRIFKKYTDHTPSAFIKQQKSGEISNTF
ncbi:MAG: helix-turn-helix domain-containing protein [Cyclobacteriaceae bacterium]